MLAKRTRSLFLLGVLLAGVLGVAGVATALEVGEKAPDFTLPSTTGEKISLSQFQGKKPVLLEFYVAATRRLAKPLSQEDAERRVHELSGADVVEVTVPLVRAAVALSREHRLSLWDALIVESARARGCRRLYSEDLQHGREFGTTRVENPFLSG